MSRKRIRLVIDTVFGFSILAGWAFAHVILRVVLGLPVGGLTAVDHWRCGWMRGQGSYAPSLRLRSQIPATQC